ncbi:MAG: nuclease [Cyanobium sp.]
MLQVRGATLLQIGDGNRNYALELACLQVDPADSESVLAWLRRELPRRTRINLRPMAPVDGRIVARVTRLGDGEDLSSRLIAAGLAQPDPTVPACAVALSSPQG